MSMEATSFKIDRPRISEAQIAENPWYTVELSFYDNLASGEHSVPTDSADEETPESFLWEFWGIVAKVAGEVPYEGPYQERLIDLLKALRGLPKPVDLELENWGLVKLWADLPLLGPVFREALDIDQGINLEAFITRLTQSGIANWSWLGLVVIHGALEVEPDPRAHAYKEQATILYSTVPHAVMWLEIAGMKLYEEVKAGSLNDQKYASGGTWKGPAGFSEERWNYWKKWSGEIGAHEQVSDAMEAVRKGLRMMSELER